MTTIRNQRKDAERLKQERKVIHFSFKKGHIIDFKRQEIEYIKHSLSVVLVVWLIPFVFLLENTPKRRETHFFVLFRKELLTV